MPHYLLCMRYLIALLAFTPPALAWEFTPGLPCVLSHESAEGQIVLTYDPAQPLYSVTVRRAAPWPEAPTFGMRFDGPQGRVIGTDRHVLSADRRAVTVTDRGFGNVLDGLQYNRRTTAITGEAELSFSLEGAAEPVALFRACEGDALAS